MIPGHDAVAQAAAASGVAARHLTTLGRLYGLHVAPYTETVVLAPGTPNDHPASPGWIWESYLWRSFGAAERMRRGNLPPATLSDNRKRQSQ